MKYKVGDKTALGDIIDADEERFMYTISMKEGVFSSTMSMSEYWIDKIIIKPKRNIDKIAELWSDGKREDAKELYDHIQFIDGSHSGTMINGLLAPYSEPYRYPKLTSDELKAVKWLVDGGFEHIVRKNGATRAHMRCDDGSSMLVALYSITCPLVDSTWITESPINLRELLAAQED